MLRVTAIKLILKMDDDPRGETIAVASTISQYLINACMCKIKHAAIMDITIYSHHLPTIGSFVR